jgi:hypothetical protein
MKTIVFTGPTLSPAAVSALLPTAEVRGPIACGELLQIARHGPAVFAIIDGFFEHRLPVWHKEILWALAHGSRVYGAASMGALRAAELAAFGMIGVGAIFAAYRDGHLEDDDEVAIVHEDASRNYRARSDAMVNVRATIKAATEARIIDQTAASALVAAVKATPYPQRSLRRTLLESALPPLQKEALLRWLDRDGFVDQKRADAEVLLRQIASATPERNPATPRPAFSYTEVFHELVQSLAAPLTQATKTEGALALEDLIEELQLRGAEEYLACRAAAAEKALARLSGHPADDPSIEAALWRALPEVLRERGSYAAFVERAQDKSARLATSPEAAVRVPRGELVAWHFDRLARPVPSDVGAYARALGLPDEDSFVVAVARERWYHDQNEARNAEQPPIPTEKKGPQFDGATGRIL